MCMIPFSELIGNSYVFQLYLWGRTIILGSELCCYLLTEEQSARDLSASTIDAIDYFRSQGDLLAKAMRIFSHGTFNPSPTGIMPPGGSVVFAHYIGLLLAGARPNSYSLR